MAARLPMRRYYFRNRTPHLRVSLLSPFIASCSNFASVFKVIALGCTVVSTVTRFRSRVRSAPVWCATLKLSSSRSSSLSPSRFLQWVRSQRSCRIRSGKTLRRKCWKYGSKSQRSHTPSSDKFDILRKISRRNGSRSRPAFAAINGATSRHTDPVDFASELHQLVLHVDDLLEPGAKQITFPRRLRLLRSHRSLRCDHRIMRGDSRESLK